MPRRRYELTDEQYECIEHLLPEVEGRGCPYNDHREVINGIFWILRSGAPWRDMPERYGNWKTVYDRFRRWAEDGTLESIVRHLQGELDAEGRIDWSQGCLWTLNPMAMPRGTVPPAQVHCAACNHFSASFQEEDLFALSKYP